MPSKFLGPVVLSIFVLIALVWSSVFIVSERHQALVLYFGGVDRIETEPGLKFKWPIAETVIMLEKRIIPLDAPEQQMTARDQDILFIDAFARYKIIDPRQYYVSTRGRARELLLERLKTKLQNAVGKVDSPDVIKGRRAEIMQQIANDVNSEARSQFGVEIIDVRIQNVNFNEKVRSRIYRNMIVNLRKKANSLRSNGKRIAEDIESGAQSRSSQIVAKARAEAARIRAEGELERNQILTQSYGKDPEFFAFYRSLEAYEKALNNSADTTLVLSPDSEFFRFFGNQSGQNKSGATGAPQ